MLGGSCSKVPAVLFTVQIHVPVNLVGRYSSYQVELSNRVVILRDSYKKTYKEIAKHLTFEGFTSPLNLPLDSKIVFSIYKKRNIRDARLSRSVTHELSFVCVYEPESIQYLSH